MARRDPGKSLLSFSVLAYELGAEDVSILQVEFSREHNAFTKMGD